MMNTNDSTKPGKLLAILKQTNVKKLELLKEENGKTENNNDKTDDKQNNDNGDSDKDDDDDDNGSDSTGSDNRVEMELYTLDDIIQKAPIIFLAYEFYFENQHWYYANIWHTLIGFFSILRIAILILG